MTEDSGRLLLLRCQVERMLASSFMNEQISISKLPFNRCTNKHLIKPTPLSPGSKEVLTAYLKSQESICSQGEMLGFLSAYLLLSSRITKKRKKIQPQFQAMMNSCTWNLNHFLTKHQLKKSFLRRYAFLIQQLSSALN